MAGAASGGVWLSTNNGTNFSQIFNNEPTQAVGAIALDTTTSPSTIYVATGEGNGSLDSLYGQGIFKSSDLGMSWTSLGSSGAVRSRVVHQPCDRHHHYARDPAPVRGSDQWAERERSRRGYL